MLNSYISTFKKYVQFSGRATRSEFWTFTLGNLVISIVISILGMILAQISDSLTIISSLLSVLFSLATLLPGISVLVRRLHDTGRSGWWYWIALVPLAGPIILLVFLCTDSKEGENQFEPNPKKSR
jgi:uncharacterized membrane protein YhaH (DUF805 family)